ncbi:LysR family transcriptional regulator [Amantichitinum ursilacus]|uniref:HTH-type transcriptional regulator BenM n=1 Tax=Amantichitinum ursilacus TaxID=857265 RepID=A0A0N0XJY5_9NEIS|nr:LysR family transcriptional regulator [Amantichitinum ursilacus]KPC53737.1 HTH-type transcriptional regulator BenM [Amantichitinum ursilacus]
MELRDLRAFAVLGELLHFGRAAERLHVTQSALSKQIQRLEYDVGGALFMRSARETRLTELGAALRPDAVQALAQIDQLKRKAQAVLAGEAGTLRIGFGIGAKTLVPAAISQFRKHRPDVHIELFDLSSHHIVRALTEGKLDVGFCRLPAPAGWPHLPVVQARFVAVLPDSYRDIAHLRQLSAQRLVLIEHTLAPAFHAHLMTFLAGQGVRISDIQPVRDFVSGVTLAAAGVGWTVVPSSTVVDVLGVRVLQLEDPAASWAIGLMRPASVAGPLVAAFWDVVQKTLLREVD